jgi:hypothetical protein
LGSRDRYHHFRAVPRAAPLFRLRPYVLGPTVALLGAEHTSPQTFSEQSESFRAAEDLYFVTKRLPRPGRARRSQAKIAWVAFVFRISSVVGFLEKHGQYPLQALKLLLCANPSLGVKRPSLQRHSSDWRVLPTLSG